MRYLVVEKRMLLHEERDLPIETLLENIDSLLRVLPADTDNQQIQNDTANVPQTSNASSYNNADSTTSTSTNSKVESGTNLKNQDNQGSSNEVRNK